MPEMRETDRLKIHSYCGPSLRANSSPPETIIENYLWKEDAMMILGSEKAGKSILAQQMFCHIVTGEPFLGHHAIKKRGPVVYIQAEGKRDEFVNRLNNISMSFQRPMDDSQFLHIFKKYCPLNVPIFMKAIFEKIDAQAAEWGRPPVAICIDSVYKCMEGDLYENQAIIGFTNAIDELISRYQCAISLIHHDSKEWRDDKMAAIDRGDKGSYGSVFLRAYVDHIIYLKMQKDKSRTLTCDTTRSNQTQQEILNLLLIEPKPLVFQIKGDYKASAEVVLHQLRMNFQRSYDQLEAVTGLSRPTLQQAMHTLIKAGKVDFVDAPTERLFFLHEN